MKFDKVIDCLRLGLKIKRKSWNQNHVWYMEDGNLYNNRGELINDWEVLGEQKSK